MNGLLFAIVPIGMIAMDVVYNGKLIQACIGQLSGVIGVLECVHVVTCTCVLE